MFNKGDTVILKYPEKSRMDDTMKGITKGYIKEGAKYKVLDTDKYGHGVIVLLNGEDRSWWVGADALVKYPIRNLPEWF